jgi:hypothetical protein
MADVESQEPGMFGSAELAIGVGERGKGMESRCSMKSTWKELKIQFVV